MRSEHRKGKKPITSRLFFRRDLVLLSIQTLFLASAALLLMFCDADWVTYFERVRPVRNFMANPLEMIGVEVFGLFCILVGVSGVMEGDDSLLDAMWAGYVPLLIGACLIVLFVSGLFRPLHNPGHADHRFRWMPSTHYGPCRPPVPTRGVQFFLDAGIGGRLASESVNGMLRNPEGHV